MLTALLTTTVFLTSLTINLKAVVAPQEAAAPDRDNEVSIPVIPSRLQVIQVAGSISFSKDSESRDNEALLSGELIGTGARLQTSKSLEGRGSLVGSLYVQLGTPVVLGRPGYVFMDAFLTDENCKTRTDEEAQCEISLPAFQTLTSKDELSENTREVRLSIYRWGKVTASQLKNFVPPNNESLNEFLSRIMKGPKGESVTADALQGIKAYTGYFLFDRILFDRALDKPVTLPEGKGSTTDRRFALDQINHRIPLLSPQNRANTQSHRYLILKEVSTTEGGATRVTQERAFVEVLPGQFVPPAELKFESF